MHKLGLSLLLLVISIGSANAVRIYGTVKTADNGTPLDYINIQSLDINNKALDLKQPDSNGNFDFNVPNETKTVRISYLGTSPQTFSPGELNGKTIILQPAPETFLGEAHVVAHRKTTSDSGGDGCDKETNDRITPELALCSVHAYNIGMPVNPAGADKQLMKEIVALKTTVIAQQMNKQYEYMDAMIRRFKTQLEKAVLTTKLQAAGATPSSTDSSASSGGSSSGGYGASGAGRANNGLANAEDCMNTYTNYSDIYQCLLRNVTKIQAAVTAGDLGTARRQLATDKTVLTSFNNMSISCPSNQSNCKINQACDNALSDNKTCAKAIDSGSSRNNMTTCLGQFRACIIANSDELQRKNNQSGK